MKRIGFAQINGGIFGSDSYNEDIISIIDKQIGEMKTGNTPVKNKSPRKKRRMRKRKIVSQQNPIFITKYSWFRTCLNL
jgi:hypothetical protein